MASLCLLARVSGIDVTGVETSEELAALAQENAIANGFGEVFHAIAADVTAPWSVLEGAGLQREAYDHVIANPPFYTHGRARLSNDGRKARSRAMNEGGLDAWLRFLAGAAKPGGTATVIHTAEALPELLLAAGVRFGGLHLIPLHPGAGAPGNPDRHIRKKRQPCPAVPRVRPCASRSRWHAHKCRASDPPGRQRAFLTQLESSIAPRKPC